MLAAKMIYSFRHRYLIMCGIAAGIGEESAQLYGDVLVPDMIWDYSTGKFVGKDESEIAFGSIGFQPRPVSVRIDPKMLASVMATVGSADNGKVLRVVDGVWAAAEIASASGVSF